MHRLAIGLVMGAALLFTASPNTFAAHSDYGCHSCHVPHHALKPTDPGASWGVPLWSYAEGSAIDDVTFTLYSSPTFDALNTDISQPDGASKLCLGCHDGAYAPIAASASNTDPSQNADLGTDLTTTHPISFTYDATLAQAANGGLYNPVTHSSGLGGTIDTDLLDSHHMLQCTSCHDIHTTGIGEFSLRYEYDVTAHTDNILCRTCHNK